MGTWSKGGTASTPNTSSYPKTFGLSHIDDHVKPLPGANSMYPRRGCWGRPRLSSYRGSAARGRSNQYHTHIVLQTQCGMNLVKCYFQMSRGERMMSKSFASRSKWGRAIVWVLTHPAPDNVDSTTKCCNDIYMKFKPTQVYLCGKRSSCLIPSHVCTLSMSHSQMLLRVAHQPEFTISTLNISRRRSRHQGRRERFAGLARPKG